MSERWSGRVIERSMLKSIDEQTKRGAAIRAQRVIDEAAAQVKKDDEPVKLKAPKPLFLEPLC